MIFSSVRLCVSPSHRESPTPRRFQQVRRVKFSPYQLQRCQMHHQHVTSSPVCQHEAAKPRQLGDHRGTRNHAACPQLTPNTSRQACYRSRSASPCPWDGSKKESQRRRRGGVRCREENRGRGEGDPAEKMNHRKKTTFTFLLFLIFEGQLFSPDSSVLTPEVLQVLTELPTPQELLVGTPSQMFAPPATMKPPVMTKWTARGKSVTASTAFLETDDPSVKVMKNVIIKSEM